MACACIAGMPKAAATKRLIEQRFGLDLDALAEQPHPGGDAANSDDERPRAKSSFWSKP
jgi:terminase, large subunit